MTSFAVSDVKLETRLLPTTSRLMISRRLGGKTVEACSQPLRPVVDTFGLNHFVSAVGHAFALHYPLILSPDAVWLTLAQGFANHINENAEKVRRRFVAHDGKAEIELQRDQFIKGSPENDWEGCFAEFSDKIRDYIGDANHRSIVADFSTTGPLERAASEVVLMDAMQAYFSYGVSTCCGIPRVELTGTVEDWERVRDKVMAWDRAEERKTEGGVILPATSLGLSWWTTPLRSVLDGLVDAADGRADPLWWESFYKENGGKGSGAVSRISGWINWFFPYIKSRRGRQSGLERNPVVGREGLEYGDGLADDDYPSSLSKVPFKWTYYSTVFEMDFLAGIAGVEQDAKTLALTPVAGWAVRERPEDSSVTKSKRRNAK
jgi:Domain of unknown function (DUF4419)